MCRDDSPAGPVATVWHDFEPAVRIDLEPVDSVVITTLMDNVTDMLLPDLGPARRVRMGSGPWRPTTTMTGGQVPDALIAEHGFSALVTVTRGGREHRFLFDTGASPDGVTENMRRLGVDPGSIEAIVCSHGHFDHTAGIDGLVRTLGRTSLPVLIHPHFWRQRRLQLPGRDPLELPTTSRAALTGAGFEIIEEQQPSFLFDRSVLVTGEVPRVTGYEPGFPPQQAWLDGAWQPDPLVLDDQALIFQVAGKGLVVITGCGHAGVVNIARYARRLTGDQPLYALVGGFHLNGPLFEPLIPQVLDDLAELDPGVLVPAHCTGWRAQHALAGRFPDAFVPNSVGTSFFL
jgi:7,8-dihydropterin-6-yl-methyl-4-(beta-D-ribofuranosyl)aminobenzene 5'-phosphate synthase